MNNLFVICGNCRTFINCIDSCYERIISKLFSNSCQNDVLFYLKLNDPGPKNQDGWNFSYDNQEYKTINDKLDELASKYNIRIYRKILFDNEISDYDILNQVKDRTKYIRYLKDDFVFLRALHCHFNFECCGKIILEIEIEQGFKYDYIIYVRPDLYFTSDCESIDKYSKCLITLGKGPYVTNNDHIAIIPRIFMKRFFFHRMNVYRSNTTKYFDMPESVYWYKIPYRVMNIGNYIILRDLNQITSE